MSRPPRFTAQEVQDVTAAALSSPIGEVEHLPVGWGNENWRVRVGGQRFIAKLGPPESAKKWAATHSVYRLGSSVGLSVPELVHFDAACAAVGGWTLRIFTWMDGVAPAEVLRDQTAISRFFGELARSLRTLHSLPAPAFSSRLDGSAPSYARWSDYIAYRLPRVLERVRATACFADADAVRVVDSITSLATAVDASARSAICHRDVYLDNLLATPSGGVAAILDFDGAEAWDPAIDLVKLRWLVFPDHPGAEDAFIDSYGEPPQWEDRLRLAELLELLNAVPNAVATGDAEFEASARRRLQMVLDG
jgi:aminoglycoside phosphotransferase (APT) family kinase protein